MSYQDLLMILSFKGAFLQFAREEAILATTMFVWQKATTRWFQISKEKEQLSKI